MRAHVDVDCEAKYSSALRPNVSEPYTEANQDVAACFSSQVRLRGPVRCHTLSLIKSEEHAESRSASRGSLQRAILYKYVL